MKTPARKYEKSIKVKVWQLRWEDAVIVETSVSRVGMFFWILRRWKQYVWKVIINAFNRCFLKPMSCGGRNRKTNLSAIPQISLDDKRNAVLKNHLADFQSLLAILDCKIRDFEDFIHNSVS
jgi:hypothetical protein